jgi:hypothetical protein
MTDANCHQILHNWCHEQRKKSQNLLPMYSVHSPMAFQMCDRHKVRRLFHMAHLSGKDVKTTINKITKKNQFV